MRINKSHSHARSDKLPCDRNGLTLSNLNVCVACKYVIYLVTSWIRFQQYNVLWVTLSYQITIV